MQGRLNGFKREPENRKNVFFWQKREGKDNRGSRKKIKKIKIRGADRRSFLLARSCLWGASMLNPNWKFCRFPLFYVSFLSYLNYILPCIFSSDYTLFSFLVLHNILHKSSPSFTHHFIYQPHFMSLLDRRNPYSYVIICITAILFPVSTIFGRTYPGPLIGIWHIFWQNWSQLLSQTLHSRGLHSHRQKHGHRSILLTRVWQRMGNLKPTLEITPLYESRQYAEHTVESQICQHHHNKSTQLDSLNSATSLPNSITLHTAPNAASVYARNRLRSTIHLCDQYPRLKKSPPCLLRLRALPPCTLGLTPTCPTHPS